MKKQKPTAHADGVRHSRRGKEAQPHDAQSPEQKQEVVFVGGALAGIPELLFAILIAACIKILLDEVVLRGLEDGPGSCNRLAYSTARHHSNYVMTAML